MLPATSSTGLTTTAASRMRSYGLLISRRSCDLIDNRDGMLVSGRLDNAAFAGEPSHDDADGCLAETSDEGDDRDGLTVINDERGSFPTTTCEGW